MKVILFSILLLLIISGCIMAFKKATAVVSVALPDLKAYDSALYPVKQNGKWGYMNNKLALIINPVYMDAEDFSQGLAAVSGLADDDRGSVEKYGFIDIKGKLIVSLKYDKVLAFADGMAVVMESEKYGYVDQTGREVIAPQYQDAASFSNGLAAVKVNGRNGFINKAGKMVIEPLYTRACWVSQFSEGLAPVYLEDNTAGFIDESGAMVIKPEFSYVSSFSEGLALVQPIGNPHFGYINKKGEMVIKPAYELSLPFVEGVATVKLMRPDGSFVFRIIDRQGKVIADNLDYGFVGIFREGLAGVESHNYQWGFINKKGEEVIAPRFASVRLFNNGLSKVETGSLFKGLETAYIDKTGKILK